MKIYKILSGQRYLTITNCLKFKNKEFGEYKSVFFFPLTYLKPMFHFYTPRKRQEIKVFWRFQGVQKVTLGQNRLIIMQNATYLS